MTKITGYDLAYTSRDFLDGIRQNLKAVHGAGLEHEIRNGGLEWSKHFTTN